MSKDMDKPGFTFTVDRYEPDDAGVGRRLVVNSNATAHNVGEAASLLEAAPDLLAAVEMVFDAAEDNGDMEDIDWDTLRAALSRAKGGV